MQQDRFYHP